MEQSVARRAHNPKVEGSSPSPATNADVAQSAERILGKDKVTGSIPVISSSGGVAQLARASGSYPLCPQFKSVHRHHHLRLTPLPQGLIKFKIGRYIMQESFCGQSDFRRDTKHWNHCYKKIFNLNKPSLFAQFVRRSYLKTPATLLELGCGNGRDSLYFAAQGLKVTAVDASDYAIDELNQRGVADAEFFCDDFVSSEQVYSRQYDYCYSRFSLHAINATQEDLLLTNVKAALKDGGKFFIEVRSVNDPLFGKGERVANTTAEGYVKNCFINNGHFRRFIERKELEETLLSKGYKLEYSAEKTGFAPFGSEDPPVIRIVASV